METKNRLFHGLLLLTAALTVTAQLHESRAGQGGKFDKLSAADRQMFSERFQKEIWPLLERGGKDGCVGCHNGKKVTTLRFSGDPAKDFPMLVGDGYMLRKDPGSLLERIIDKDDKRRMPPNGKPGWTDEEVKLLRDFVDDLDKKNKL
jgi:hypothetical protein